MTDQLPGRFEELLGSHRQDFSEIRRLCLICHGLDNSADTIFSGSIYTSPSDEFRCVFQNLMSGSLLNLAVALRVNGYQAAVDVSRDLSIQCASLYWEPDLIVKQVSIKDVIDKIIHADFLSKETSYGTSTEAPRVMMQLKGVHRKRKWILDINIQYFVEVILELIDSFGE